MFYRFILSVYFESMILCTTENKCFIAVVSYTTFDFSKLLDYVLLYKYCIKVYFILNVKWNTCASSSRRLLVLFWNPSVPSTLLNNIAGRDPVVSSKHTLPLLSWYNGLPFSQQRRVVGSKGRCVCVECVCVQIQGSIH